MYPRWQVVAVSSLAQMLRRYTSLNHLAQAARAVLHNTDQIKQMLQDLNRVDFHNVHEQVRARQIPAISLSFAEYSIIKLAARRLAFVWMIVTFVTAKLRNTVSNICYLTRR